MKRPKTVLLDGVHHPVLPASVVARAKGVFLETVYRAVERGALHGYKAGSTWLVHNDQALDDWEPPPAHRPRTVKRRPERSRKMKPAMREEGPPGPGVPSLPMG